MIKKSREAKSIDEVSDSGYSLGAFFGTFGYYFTRGLWKIGLLVLLLVSAVPLKFYFVPAFFIGYIEGKKDREKNKLSITNMVITCLMVLCFCVIKAFRGSILGTY